jgi:tetratricopeptide (TPR) repeat protein
MKRFTKQFALCLDNEGNEASGGRQASRVAVGKALLFAAILLPSVSVASSADVSPQQPAQLLYTLDEYFALSERARKGDVDGAVAEIRTWNWHAFRDLRDQLERSRRGLEGPSQRVLVKWGRADIEALAMLHTETAIRSAALSTVEASHANWARQLLGLFDGLNVDQSFRRRWHVAWGAHLQSTLRLRELTEHLHDALREWPEDPDLLILAASAYESLSRRAAIERVDSDYIPLQSRLRREVPDRRRSQTLALNYYQRALGAKPDLFDAHLRLGRMLLESNQSDEALVHVTRAAERAASPKEHYLARLFLGRVHAGAERWPEAVAAYADADTVLAGCQSSALALSHALLKQGERTKAQAQIKIAVARADLAPCEDPWWEYEFGYGRRTDALFEQLREGLRR